MRHFEKLPFRQRASIRPIPRALALLAAAPLVAHAAGALPNGGHFVAGNGAISANGTSVTINQSTSRGIVDWTSFSIANGNRVTFNNGNGATLNRVTGGDPSVIMGMLTGSGSVYLINPQGVVVSPSGVIATGGRFVASTLDTDNAAFMTGADLRFTGSSKAQIVNLGKIGSSQGDVILIAADEIDNFGTISAPNGTAELAVGQHMLLRDSATGNQVSVLVGSGGTVLNRGAVEAAQINLQAVDGNVFALSGNHAAVRATGTATRAGHVWLVAGNGIVKISNPVEAKNVDGSGGTVDTSAAALAFAGYRPSVLAGVWNIATPTFTVDPAAAAMFSRSLAAGTSIDLQTTGAYGRTGDIDVAKTIDWRGNASLTLGAYRNVSVEKGVALRNEGTGNLTLRADTTAIDNGAGVFNAGTLDWSKSTGIVSLLYDMNGSYSPGTLLSNASWASPLYSGLVTQITGYKLINSGTDLQNVDNDLAGNYALGKDLDMTNAGFNTLADPNNNRNTPDFTGQLDGMWHTISNLAPNDISLFFFQSGTIRDLYVNAETGGAEPNFFSGILAAFNSGTIANVFTSGDIGAGFGFGAKLAGLVGENGGLIARSGSSAGVGGDFASAGLVGDNGGTIVESYVTGGVGSSWRGTVGGLVLTNGGTIQQSYVSAGVFNNNPNDPGGAICDGCKGVSSDVYWNVQTTGYASSGSNLPASNGLTTAQMSNPASFSGWDFGPNGAWAMPAGATQPVLRWQIEHPSGGTPPGAE